MPTIAEVQAIECIRFIEYIALQNRVLALQEAVYRRQFERLRDTILECEPVVDRLNTIINERA